MSTNNQTSLGMNRTGLQMSPQDSKRLLDTADSIVTPPDPTVSTAMRKQYIEDAEPLGSVPLPGTLKGAITTGAKLIGGQNPQLLLDKLAERLAYERGGTRVYDALITKFDAASDISEIVTRDELLQIRNEELQHFQLLSGVIREMGGDPTSQTPSAALVGIETGGIVKAVTDPRTSFVESLHAVLVAELTDVAGWELLSSLAEMLNETELVLKFRMALAEENDHLFKVQRWYTELTLNPV
jgi:rubrerythrin